MNPKALFSALLQHHQFAIVDIETTGGKAETGKIIEIAVILTNGETILEEFTTLINPQQPIPPTITKLTGITDTMVQNAPTYAQIAPKLVDLLQASCFVAHNAKFDYSFLKKEFNLLQIPFHMEKFCTVKLAQKLIPLNSYRLDEVCKFFGITILNRHRAYGDALATAQVFHQLLHIIKNRYGKPAFLF